MESRVAIAIYVVAMVAVIVGVDILFLSHHTFERLLVNVRIVLVFVVFYLVFFKRH